MRSDGIILGTILETRTKPTILRSAQLPVMQVRLFRESPRLPLFHAGRDVRNPVDRTAFCRHVSTNLLEALAPEYLTRAGNVFDTHEAVVIAEIRRISERSSHQSQCLIFRELL